MRLERAAYPDEQSLHQALMAKEVHAIAIPMDRTHFEPASPETGSADRPAYQISVRVRLLYEMMQAELPPSIAAVRHIEIPGTSKAKASNISNTKAKLAEEER